MVLYNFFYSGGQGIIEKVIRKFLIYCMKYIHLVVLHLKCRSECCLLSFKSDLGALSSKFHLVSSSSEGPQKQEQLEKLELEEMEIMESEDIKGEQKNLVLGIIE